MTSGLNAKTFRNRMANPAEPKQAANSAWVMCRIARLGGRRSAKACTLTSSRQMVYVIHAKHAPAEREALAGALKMQDSAVGDMDRPRRE